VALPNISDLLEGGSSTRTAITLLTPANNSGVVGLGLVSLDGTELTTGVVASGLTPDQVHPVHIHGFPPADGEGGEETPATERLALAADDQDGDGFVETPEGESAAFGPVLAGLTTTGADAGLEVSPDYPSADAAGRLSFTQSYELNPEDADDAAILDQLSDRLDGRVLELHGLDLAAGAGAGTPNEVNGSGGYNPQVPVAQGKLIELPDGLDLVVSALVQNDPEAFLSTASDVLGLLAPYSLNPEGTGPQEPEPAGFGEGAETFASLLLPSNGSGVLGTTVVRFDEEAGTVEVKLDASGLEPGQVHPMHIHGFADDNPSLLPNYRLDADLDGFVEAPEGEPAVGPAILALTADGSISNAVLGANFPVADAEGNISFEQTYQFDTSDPTQLGLLQELRDRMAGRSLEIHGLSLPATEGEGTPGEVDGTEGYKESLPVANGVLLPVDGEGGIAESFGPVGGVLTDAIFGV
jgi:hypothetical protein